MWKVYNNKDGNNDNVGQRTKFVQKKLTWDFDSGELNVFIWFLKMQKQR